MISTNQVIEERSNEDDGQTTSQQSLRVMSQKSKHYTGEDQSMSQLHRASLTNKESNKEYSSGAKKQQSTCAHQSHDNDCLPYIDQSQIFDQIGQHNTSKGSPSRASLVEYQ